MMIALQQGLQGLTPAMQIFGGFLLFSIVLFPCHTFCASQDVASGVIKSVR